MAAITRNLIQSRVTPQVIISGAKKDHSLRISPSLEIDRQFNARWSLNGSFYKCSLKDIATRASLPISQAKTEGATESPTLEKPEGAKFGSDSRVTRIHSKEDFDRAIEGAKRRLVVIEYGASHSAKSAKIYPAMVDISRQAQDVDFYLILGDESEETAELCKLAGVERVPHFIFYKGGEVVHEEEGVSPDQLLSDVLYYGDTEAPVVLLHGKEDFENLLKEHVDDNKLVVVDVSMKHCGPCARVYPTVIKLSKTMQDSVVFARIIGDENDSCKELMRIMNVVEVPEFLFIRDGKLIGRYVGSGRGELIGEILRYQGVKCT